MALAVNRHGTFAAVLVTILALGCNTAAAVITSDFDDGTFQGWTGVPGETTNLSIQTSGGNPGGYIENFDGGPTSGSVLAPSTYLGDWTSIDGIGMLSWDFLMIAIGIGNPVTLGASISGPGGSATFDSGIFAPLGQWISLTADIEEAVWTVDSGDWTALLADVTELRVQIENVFSTGPGETTGIDNIELTSFGNGNPVVPRPMPTPGTILLMFAGVLVSSFSVNWRLPVHV